MSLWGRSDRGRRLVCAKLQGRPVRRGLQGGWRDQGACEEERGAILELGGLMKGRGLGVTSGACWKSGAHRGSGALGGTLGGVGAPARTCGFEAVWSLPLLSSQQPGKPLSCFSNPSGSLTLPSRCWGWSSRTLNSLAAGQSKIGWEVGHPSSPSPAISSASDKQSAPTLTFRTPQDPPNC